jgi:hypothetical protein
MWSEWYSKNTGKETSLVSAEWVLKKLDEVSGSTLKQIYPVGSIFMSVNSVNPSTWITGTTWVEWGSGRVPVGVGQTTDVRNETKNFSINQTGGEFNHKLSIDEMPAHNHNSMDMYGDLIGGTNGGEGHSSPATFQGNDMSHENMQPYITCYMWKRTT